VAKIIFDSEKELEDFICNDIEENKICPVAGTSVDLFERQLNLGAYGVADIVKISIEWDHIDVTVLEVKKETITSDAIIQTVRYMEGLKHFIGEYFADMQDQEIFIYGEIAAPNSSLGDGVFLLNVIDNLNIYEISCDLMSGFSSECIGNNYVRTVPNFKHLIPKARLIRKKHLEVIKTFRSDMRKIQNSNNK